MIKVGLTGGFGSGKSLVAGIYQEAGIPVIDSDKIARDVVAPKSAALEQLRQAFGPEIMTDNGALDREKLAAIAFNDEAARLQMNQIIHPAVREQIQEDLAKHQSAGADLVIIDVPLLYESELDSWMDTVIVVWAPKNTSQQRLMEHRDFSLDDIERRMNAQHSLDDKKARADYVIDNSGAKEATRKQSLEILQQIRSSSSPSP